MRDTNFQRDGLIANQLAVLHWLQNFDSSDYQQKVSFHQGQGLSDLRWAGRAGLCALSDFACRKLAFHRESSYARDQPGLDAQPGEPRRFHDLEVTYRPPVNLYYLGRRPTAFHCSQEFRRLVWIPQYRSNHKCLLVIRGSPLKRDESIAEIVTRRLRSCL